MTISVLGAEYTVRQCTATQDKMLAVCDGYCDDSVKLIVINNLLEGNSVDSKHDLEKVRQKCLRHEIVHAFLSESGLGNNCDWANNETIVDWIAMQGPKIHKVWEEAGAL